MLDGELAVPCNLKSAYAGLNSDGWVLLSLIFFISGVDSFSSAQWYKLETRQIWKEAAVESISMCRRILKVSWL